MMRFNTSCHTRTTGVSVTLAYLCLFPSYLERYLASFVSHLEVLVRTGANISFLSTFFLLYF